MYILCMDIMRVYGYHNTTRVWILLILTIRVATKSVLCTLCIRTY